MNYEYADAYLEITFPSGSVRRIKKSRIKEFYEYDAQAGNRHVKIWVEGDCYTFEGSLVELEKASKTIFI